MSKIIDINVDETLPAAGPKYGTFWIGCSDDAYLESGWPPEMRAETVIHTSLGNQVPQADLGSLTALEWAINVHNIERIVICGHYRCKVIEAAAKGDTGEIVGHWLSPLKKIIEQNQEWLLKLSLKQRLDAICELNTVYQTLNTSRNAAIKAAWGKNPTLSLSAGMNDPTTGRFRSLNFALTAGSVLSEEFESAIRALKDRWIDLRDVPAQWDVV